MNLSGSLCVFVPTFLFFPQIGDRNGELTARMNVEQLMDALGVNESDLSPCSSEFEMQGDTFYLRIGDIICQLVAKIR